MAAERTPDPTEPRLKILLVDDEPMIRSAYGRFLKSACEVRVASGAEEALAILAAETFDALLTDHDMPGRSGVWLLEEVRRRHPNVRRLLMSARVPPNLEVHRAARLFAEYIEKPASLERIRECLRGGEEP